MKHLIINSYGEPLGLKSQFCDIRPKYPKQVDFGREYHEKQSKLFADRTFAKLKIKFEKAYENIYVETEELSGVLDLVLVCARKVSRENTQIDLLGVSAQI